MVKVETIIEQADKLVGQEIDVEGYIIVLEEAKQKIVFVASSNEISEKDSKKLFVDHSLAELKTIIRPLPSMQLMFRGVLIYPPYFFNFPARFRATVDMDKDNNPTLREISKIEITVPFTGKTAEMTEHDSYVYLSKVDYTVTPVEEEKRTARALVTTQKKLLLVKDDIEAELIPAEENRYARRIANRVVRLSGWIEIVPSKNDIMNHIFFFTTAIRASMVAVGPLREETPIWIRPGLIYKLLKAHIPRKPGEFLSQKVEIIGEVDYLQDEDSMIIGEKSPKLVFTHLVSVIIYEVAYLW